MNTKLNSILIKSLSEVICTKGAKTEILDFDTGLEISQMIVELARTPSDDPNDIIHKLDALLTMTWVSLEPGLLENYKNSLETDGVKTVMFQHHKLMATIAAELIDELGTDERNLLGSIALDFSALAYQTMYLNDEIF